MPRVGSQPELGGQVDEGLSAGNDGCLPWAAPPTEFEGRISTVVAFYRTLGPLHLGDSGMRRNVEITRAIDDLAERGLRLVFGDRPTPDEVASYWILNDLAPVLRRLARMPDEELQATLVQLNLRTLGV